MVFVFCGHCRRADEEPELLTCPLYAGIDTCLPCRNVKTWAEPKEAGKATAAGGFLCSRCHTIASDLQSLLKSLLSAAVSWAASEVAEGRTENVRNLANEVCSTTNEDTFMPIVDAKVLSGILGRVLDDSALPERSDGNRVMAALAGEVLEEREKKRKRSDDDGSGPKRKKKRMDRAVTWDISQLGYDEEKDELRKETKAWERTPSMTTPLTPLSLYDLRVTQDNIRCSDNLQPMIDHVKAGGLFSGMCVFSFPDGRKFLHDGHHRVVSIWLGGRRHLEPQEYVVINSTYENITSVLFDKFFVTPFDPRTEMRYLSLSRSRSRFTFTLREADHLTGWASLANSSARLGPCTRLEMTKVAWNMCATTGTSMQCHAP